MSRKFYAVNRETGERWKPDLKKNNFAGGYDEQYLVMYDSGYLAVISVDFYTDIEPLDPKIWKRVLKKRKGTEEKIVKKKFEGIKDIGKYPDGYEYRYGDISSLDNYDLDNLKELDITTAVYWYARGSYEGSGKIIYKSNDGWALHDMGHCSCYSCVCHLDPQEGKDIDELYNSCSEDLQKEIKDLYDYIKERI